MTTEISAGPVWTSSAATARIDEIVAAYVEVYADTEDEFFGEERFRRQLAGHMQRARPGSW